MEGDNGKLLLNHPTAFSLLENMLIVDYEVRARAFKEARTHPFFWDYATAKDIVQSSWGVMDAAKDQSAIKLKDDFTKNAAAHFKSNPWTSCIPKVYLNILNYAPSVAQGKSGFELLAALRHIINHRRDWPGGPDFRDFDCGLKRILLKAQSFILLQIWSSSSKLRQSCQSIDMSYTKGSGIRWEWKGAALEEVSQR